MKPLYIVGAGGAAKEIYLLIKEINRSKLTYDFKGFIDVSKEDVLRIGNSKFDIINESDFLNNYSDKVSVVLGLGDTKLIKKIISRYKERSNIEFPNIIHPNVSIDESMRLDIGNVITNQCVFTVDISLGSFNYINRGVHIGHDCKIGSYNVINPCSVISGGVEIGDENLVGTNATILQYLKIGSNNIIGASALLTKDIANEFRMIGIPAKNIQQ